MSPVSVTGLLCFWDRVLLHSSGELWMHDPSASACNMLGLQVCTTTCSFKVQSYYYCSFRLCNNFYSLFLIVSSFYIKYSDSLILCSLFAVYLRSFRSLLYYVSLVVYLSFSSKPKISCYIGRSFFVTALPAALARASLCIPGCTGTHCVDQASLKFRDPSASVF